MTTTPPETKTAIPAAHVVIREQQRVPEIGLDLYQRPMLISRSITVLVDGVDWGAGERHDWAPDGLVPAVRAYDRRLRTHAAADQPDPVTFLAVGDFGAKALTLDRT